ncbi:MAG: hypothetical protein ACPGYK_04730 [Flavobacteriales bacterium]
MRWTNYFPHPGDNRYHVFVFQTADLANEFANRLQSEGIPFERDQENQEWLFGIHREHFAQALQQNHLLHAAHRTPFIPVKGLRIAMLVVTLAMILLGLAGAWFSTANAQTRSPYRMVLHGAFQFPLEAVGSEPIVQAEGALELAWLPTGGSSMGLRIERELNASWHLSSGLEIIRNWSDWSLTFAPTAEEEGLDLFVQDTLRLRTVRYRLPVLATTRVSLTTDWSVHAGAGLSIDMLPSDTYISGFQQIDTAFNDFSAAENRLRWWAIPLHAELFVQHAPRSWKNADHGIKAWSLGIRWWQELARNRWGEAIWRYDNVIADTRFWMGNTAFAVEARLHLE